MDIFKTVTGFLARYADEAEAAGNALESIVASLPLNAQDRARLVAQIDTISRAPASIRDFLKGAKAPAPVQIKASDIEKAVAKVLPGLLEKTVTEAVTAALAAAAAERATEQDAGANGGGNAS